MCWWVCQATWHNFEFRIRLDCGHKGTWSHLKTRCTQMSETRQEHCAAYDTESTLNQQHLICTHFLFLFTPPVERLTSYCMHTCESVYLPFLYRTSSSSSHTNNPIRNTSPLSFRSCGLRYVHYICLDTHFTSSVFSLLTCGGSCTRKSNVVHGLRQRQRRTFSSQRCPWPWPGNLLCAVPGWRVSLEESCWSKMMCILCKMKENLLVCFILFF